MGSPNTLTKGCANLACKSLRCLEDLRPFWTISPATYNISPTPNCSGLRLISYYDHGCHHASLYRLDPEDYEVVPPLVAPPSRCLVVPAGCPIASCHPLIAPPSYCCVAPAGCQIASCLPLVAPPSWPLFTLACCCTAFPCPLVSSHSLPFVAPAG